MRIVTMIVLLVSSVLCERSVVKPPPLPKPIVFQASVQPIFEKKCTPCHFKGGVMHEKLPFDKAETITHLGEKVFSRIKNEKDRAVIRAFLAQEKGK